MSKYIRANLKIAQIGDPIMQYNVTPFTYKGVKMFARMIGNRYKISEFYSGWALPHDSHKNIPDCLKSMEEKAKEKGELLTNEFIHRRRVDCKTVTINKRFKKIWEQNNHIIWRNK